MDFPDLEVNQIVPLFDHILIDRDEAPDTTAGGILLPDEAKMRPSVGTVLACGPGRRHEKTGEFVPMNVKPGDRVYFQKHFGQDFQVKDSKKLFMMTEQQMLAKEVA